MKRRNFAKLTVLGSAGLMINPISAATVPKHEKPIVFWPWLGRLIIATIIGKVAEKTIDYFTDQLNSEEKDEMKETIINHNSYHYSPVYEYKPQIDNDFPSTGSCVYHTHFAKIAINFELDDPFTKSYWIRFEIIPNYATDHTRDLRFKPRIFEYKEVLIP